MPTAPVRFELSSTPDTNIRGALDRLSNAIRDGAQIRLERGIGVTRLPVTLGNVHIQEDEQAVAELVARYNYTYNPPFQHWTLNTRDVLRRYPVLVKRRENTTTVIVELTQNNPISVVIRFRYERFYSHRSFYNQLLCDGEQVVKEYFKTALVAQLIENRADRVDGYLTDSDERFLSVV